MRCISMGFFAEEDQPVIWRGPMLHKALEQFLTDVFWDEPDFLARRPARRAPATSRSRWRSSCPGPRSTSSPRRSRPPRRWPSGPAFMAQKVNLEVKGVIENMTLVHRRRRQALRALRRRRRRRAGRARSSVPLLGQVPLVPELREGGDTGRPIVVTDPDGEAAQAFAAIAETIDVELAPTRRYHPELKIG